MTIAAIPTRYGQRLYRSRLEARWAVYFDAMQMAFDYERQGYCIDGRNYLPDFWLPNEAGEPSWGQWAEIKPGDYFMSDDDVKLYDGLARETGHRVYVIAGNPRFRDQRVSVFQHYHNGAPQRKPLATGSIAVDLKIAWSGASNTWEVAQDNGIKLWCEKIREWLPFPDKPWGFEGIPSTERLQAAFQAATEARFEHGEQPQLPRVPAAAEALPEIDMTTFAQKFNAKKRELGLQ